MGLRRAHSYRRIERAYTRISKYREESFVRSRPHMVIAKFDTGNTAKQFADYKYNLDLISKCNHQIRHNALEAARTVGNRILETEVGKTSFHLKIVKYPHHILRENVMATGAGADRVSQGMSASFGKSVSSAAQVRVGDVVIKVGVDTLAQVAVAKRALKKTACKLPLTYTITMKENLPKVAKTVITK